MATPTELPAKNPLREIVQPFIDVVHAPRALWGVNLSYLLEGFVYFGIVSATSPCTSTSTSGWTTSGRGGWSGCSRGASRCRCSSSAASRTSGACGSRSLAALAADARRARVPRGRPDDGTRSRPGCSPRRTGRAVRDPARRARLRHVPAGGLRRGPAVHDAGDGGHGLRDAVRPDEPRRLAPVVLRPDPEGRRDLGGVSGSTPASPSLGLFAHLRDPDPAHRGAGDRRARRRRDRGRAEPEKPKAASAAPRSRAVLGAGAGSRTTRWPTRSSPSSSSA